MAKRCALCGRGPQTTYSRSHSNIKTLRKINLNLQHRTISGKKVNVCMKCIRTRKKKMAQQNTG